MPTDNRAVYKGCIKEPKIKQILFIDGCHDRIGGIESLNRNLPRELQGHNYARVTLAGAFRGMANSRRDLMLIFDLAVTWKRLFSLFLLRGFCQLRSLLFRVRATLLIREHHYSAAFIEHNVRNAGRFKALLKLAYRTAHRVVPVSEAQATWMVDQRLCPALKLLLIRHSSTLDPLLQLPLPEIRMPLTFAAFGRWTRQKGFDELLTAWARFSCSDSLRLIIAGSGLDYARLALPARQLVNVSIIHEADAAAIFARCHCVIVPSRWEPYGLVCLEARAAGRLVIVSDIDGLPEQIENPDSGMSFRSGDSADLQAKIMQVKSIVDQEPALFLKWSRQARAGALQRREQYADDLNKIIQLI